MKKIFQVTIAVFMVSACTPQDNEYLVKFHKGEWDEIGIPSGYMDEQGDTIIPIGQYFYCYTDTIRNFGMVIEKETTKILAINHNGKRLYEVFKYDNGPDYVKSGLFRIIKNGKIGYANPDGEIIIQPRYDCAYPFEGNFARVSNNCSRIQEFEHSSWESDDWHLINRAGKRVEQ